MQHRKKEVRIEAKWQGRHLKGAGSFDQKLSQRWRQQMRKIEKRFWKIQGNEAESRNYRSSPEQRQVLTEMPVLTGGGRQLNF